MSPRVKYLLMESPSGTMIWFACENRWVLFHKTFFFSVTLSSTTSGLDWISQAKKKYFRQRKMLTCMKTFSFFHRDLLPAWANGVLPYQVGRSSACPSPVR